MGSFVSIPMDVFKNCLLPFIPDYLDRVHLAMTCKMLFAEMKKSDTLTRLILQKHYYDALLIAAEMNHYPSFTRLRLLVSYVCCNYGGFMNTTNKMIIMELRLRIDKPHFFDRDALIYLYEVFKNNIPEDYFTILTSNAGRCAAFAYVGCLPLFVKYSDSELLKNDLPSLDSWCLFGKMVSYEAGLGGNIEICKSMLKEWSSFAIHVADGLKRTTTWKYYVH